MFRQKKRNPRNLPREPLVISLVENGKEEEKNHHETSSESQLRRKSLKKRYSAPISNSLNS